MLLPKLKEDVACIGALEEISIQYFILYAFSHIGTMASSGCGKWIIAPKGLRTTGLVPASSDSALSGCHFIGTLK